MELETDTLHKIIDKTCHAYENNTIEVNDGDNGNGNKEYRIVKRKTSKTKLAYLVLEEDSEVNFYFNPDHNSDLVLLGFQVIAHGE
jgi:hypothetical protein